MKYRVEYNGEQLGIVLSTNRALDLIREHLEVVLEDKGGYYKANYTDNGLIVETSFGNFIVERVSE